MDFVLSDDSIVHNHNEHRILHPKIQNSAAGA